MRCAGGLGIDRAKDYSRDFCCCFQLKKQSACSDSLSGGLAQCPVCERSIGALRYRGGLVGAMNWKNDGLSDRAAFGTVSGV